jgi:rhamnulokinase
MNPMRHNRGNHADADRRAAPSRDRLFSDNRALVAIDLGAESCRVSLLRRRSLAMEVTLVHRFPNAPIKKENSLRWDIRGILAGVEEGLRACANIAPEGIAAIGVDGWAVDYVRLAADGTPVGDPFCYRDERNLVAQKKVHAKLPPDYLYKLTGAQVLPLNTVYQLHADGMFDIDQSSRWINLPEYILYCLGADRVSEYTNATHTALLGLQDQNWCPEIFTAAGLDIGAAPPIVRTGSDVGKICDKLATLPALRDARLIAPACHDTASAIAGIPAFGNDWAFISSGTWSLVGCVLDSPQTSDTARDKNFSNEGGVGGKTYFLKNVNGMWLLRQCMEHWQNHGRSWTIDELVKDCASLDAPQHLLDVDDPDFLLPGNMPARIHTQLKRVGSYDRALSAPQLANLIFHSLAARYASVLRDVTDITGRKFARLFIVGGGSKNALLNRLTAEATNLEIVRGPMECATIGNFAVQLATLAGEFGDRTGVDGVSVAEFAQVIANAAQESIRTTSGQITVGEDLKAV